MNESMDVFLERAKRLYDHKDLERLGLSPELELRNVILAYLSLLLKGGKVAEPAFEGGEKQLFLRHFCDSLEPLLLFGFKKKALVLDIGAGVGFPSIPIRIFRPDISFLLVEPNREKAEFLTEVKAEIGLDNVEIIAGKPESVSLEKKADYVISRGGGTLQKFAQTAKPFLAGDGHMYTFKTKHFSAELNAITTNKDKDGVRIREIAQYDLGGTIQGLSLVSMEFHS